MAQNINLYEAPRRKDSAPLSRQGLVLLGALGVASLAPLYVMNLQTTQQLGEELARFKREATRIEGMLAKVPAAADSAAGRLAREEADIAALEQIATRLSAGSLDRAGSFTEQLRALGRATTDGVWLTGIRINNANAALALEGRALDAARVPALLAALRNEPQFQGRGLAAIELKTVAEAAETPAGRKKAPLVQFRIRTPESQAGIAAVAAPATTTAPAAAGSTAAAVSAGVRP